MRRALLAVAYFLAVAVALAFLVVPVLAIFLRVPPSQLIDQLSNPVVTDALIVSLKTTLIAQALVLLFGTPIGKLDVRSRQKLGLRYVTDDRLGEGIVGSLAVGLNLVLKRVGQRPFWKYGRTQRGQIEREARELVAEFDVRTPSVATRAGTLSGGNIQKVLLARELSSEPKVVVFNKPTYGLDIRTTLAVRTRIQELAADGIAALVISTDLEELLGLCDRIAVLYQGRLVGTFENGPGAAERIGDLMVGSRAA